MKFKKLLSIGLAASLLLGVVACNTDSGTKPTDGDKPATSDSGEQGGDKTEPVNISLFVPSRLPEAIYNSDTMTFKALAEKLNIKFDIDSVVQSEANEYLTTSLSAGEYPDVVASNLSVINEYGLLGAFDKLDSYLSAEKTPNINKHLLENQVVYAQTAASDGSLYGIPMQSAIRTAMGYLIRQDWLDKLDLKVPETIDDWYNVLTAFKTNDLNGEGAGAVTPLVLDRAWENYYYNFADAWGIELNPNNDFWLARDGKMEYAPLLPEAKEFITTMAKWYKEGLIDQDFVTREDTNNFHILNNTAGATVYWTGYVAGMNNNEEVKANDPNTNWQVVNPPVLKAGQEPKTYSQQAEVVPFAWGINVKTDAAVKDKIVEMFDYVYSDEGSLLFNFGIEGESYEIKDGKPVYTEKVTGGEGSTTYIRTNGMQALIGMRQMPEYEAASTPDEGVRKQLFFYDDNDLFFPFNPSVPLNQDEKPTYKEKMGAIKTKVDEDLLKFVIGTRDIAEYDNFVKEVQDLGIQELIDIKQAAYDRYSSVGK